MERGVSEDIKSLRSAFVGRMENAFIAEDGSQHFLDANEHAKMLFPVLNALEPGDPMPEDLLPLFSGNEDRVRLKNRHFEKKLIRDGDEDSVVCLTLCDITEQEKISKELEKYREDTEETVLSQSFFRANVSHEIRTPMNAIMGTADILLQENVSPKVRGYLENIKASVDNLLYIINDIFDISKIEDGSLKIKEESYEPMSFLDDLSMMFIKNIGDKPVELLYMIDPELPSKLHGDVKRIKQIIVNMVNNAIEFTDSGFICLSISMMEKFDDTCILSYSVSDSGQGIKDEDKGDLFCPFQKLNEKKRDEREGLGLGLSICKQLVKLMGGEIGVESTYGSGSRFYFTLSQGIVDDKPAASIKDKNKKNRVYCCFKDTWLEEALIQLSEQYGIEALSCGEGLPEKLRDDNEALFLFTDDISRLSGEDEKRLKENGAEICVLRNPLSDELINEPGRIYINKPVYSLNFCQVINYGNSPAKGSDSRFDFTAPEARILVVDDNEMNIQVAKGLLAPLKAHVDTAENGKAGVECVLGDHYDLIFMDHMMPVMDGVQALERIRDMKGGRYSRIPVIALSANATAEAEELFHEKGFSDFVAKPIRVKELLKCVRKWLPKDKIIENEGVPEASCREEAEELTNDTGTDGAAGEETQEETVPAYIEGLNVEKGISYCGTPALFLKCLVIFYKIIDKKTTVISKCLEDGLVRDLTIEVHALKNSARMIGAEELSEDFKELEQMGNNEDLKGLQEKTPGVLELYQSYKAILRPFSEKDNKNALLPERQVFLQELDNIKEAIDAFDMDGADEAMGRLRDFSLPGDLNDAILELDALVSDFAMEDVIKLADELKERALSIENWGA